MLRQSTLHRISYGFINVSPNEVEQCISFDMHNFQLNHIFTSYILDIQIFGRTTGLPSHSYPLTRFGSFLCRSRCIAALVWIAPFMASAIHFLDPLLWERPGVTKQQENTKKTLENMHEKNLKQIWKHQLLPKRPGSELDTFAVEKHHSHEGQTRF